MNSKKVAVLTGLILLLVALAVSSHKDRVAAFEPGEDRPGGDSSVAISGRNAFSLPSANMKITRRLDFSVGNSFFRNPWVAAPATTTARDGLGPLFNTNGCQNCHIKDGRGHAPMDGDINQVSMLVRISVPIFGADGETVTGSAPHPVYGGQIQDFALPGLEPEAKVRVRYEYSEVKLAGGEVAQLRKPVLTLENPAYGPLPENLMASMRVAPPMHGLGLLEAIPESSLVALEDPEDRDNDNISGRANRVLDREKNTTVLGRFGWKAGQPTLKQQNAAAFNGDLGLSTTLFTRDGCTDLQAECIDMRSGDQPEVSDSILDQVTFYSRNLGVPVRTLAENSQVLKGKALFNDTGCASCHTPSFKTAELENHPEQSGQLIWPYTDLLLHDMGDALADHRPEAEASGREWRTPPLWGIGHTFDVSEEATFLHDGRARTILEAILWHGGEAEAARDRVVAMNPEQRKRLLTFIESL